MEIHLDSPTGELIGETEMIPEQFNTRYRGAFGGLPENQLNKEIINRYPKLDQSKFFAPGADKNSFTIPSYAPLKEVNGYRDVYFVFTNDSVKSEESLFPLAWIEFSNKIKSN